MQVPQPSLAIITVDARALGAEQEGQVTYVLEQLLPGQHVGASAWYNFAKEMLHESGMQNFPKEPTLFRMILHADHGLLASQRENGSSSWVKLEAK